MRFLDKINHPNLKAPLLRVLKSCPHIQPGEALYLGGLCTFRGTSATVLPGAQQCDPPGTAVRPGHTPWTPHFPLDPRETFCAGEVGFGSIFGLISGLICPIIEMIWPALARFLTLTLFLTPTTILNLTWLKRTELAKEAKKSGLALQ